MSSIQMAHERLLDALRLARLGYDYDEYWNWRYRAAESLLEGIPEPPEPLPRVDTKPEYPIAGPRGALEDVLRGTQLGRVILKKKSP